VGLVGKTFWEGENQVGVRQLLMQNVLMQDMRQNMQL